MSTFAALQNAVLRLQSAVTQPEAAVAADPAAYNLSVSAAADELATLFPALQTLSADERKQLEPTLAILLSQLENAIAALSATREDTAQQLKTLHHRTAAMAAYNRK